MVNKDGYALIGRAVTDPEFRKRLIASPDDTIAAEQLSISPDLLAQIKALDARVAEQVGDVMAAAFGSASANELSAADLDAVAGGQSAGAGAVGGASLVNRPGLVARTNVVIPGHLPGAVDSAW